jgi:uncharacterized protein YeeX (DUF496 family)|tara:strand:+ start:1187 stop:1405 length:219 start_codon:yes stop_codon:yes gene_type:complete
MPADVPEVQDAAELLATFKERYNRLANETKEMQEKIRQNEQTGLKLMGAIETLEYLNPPDEDEVTETETTEE